MEVTEAWPSRVVFYASALPHAELVEARAEASCLATYAWCFGT